MSKTIAILQFPGSNCESETARVLRTIGVQTEVFRWNRPAVELETFDGYIIPGGFAYEDRVRAGVIAAKEPIFDTLAAQAEQGKPILGICNGAQILLETGLLPATSGKPGQVEMALAHNYFTYNKQVVRHGHHCGWVNLRCEQSPLRTVFTRKMKQNSIFPITVSHGEGRFTSSDPELYDRLQANQQILWRYCDSRGNTEAGLPTNPNGSLHNLAGLCNPQGNVAALMPHPERAFYLRQVPSSWDGVWGEERRSLAARQMDWNTPGPGFALFESLAQALDESN